MFYNAKSGNVKIRDTDMDYVCFGSGSKNLIMLPGLGDGLKTVKGTAIPFAMLYRIFAKDYRVYVFSRKNKLEEGYSTKNMAKDQVEAMRTLGISKASVIGVSEGGMIAQYIAIDFPGVVEKLVLAVTVSRPNDTVQNVVSSWIRMAKSNDYEGIFIDTAEKSYSEEYLRKHRLLYKVFSKVGRPKDLTRFIIQANACIHHETYHELKKIQCKTLVIGGNDDRVVGRNSSKEISEQIPGCKLILYEGLGHATYEEAKDFNPQVLDFLEH